MIEIKSEREICFIEDAAKVVKRVLQELKKFARSGVRTEELDRKAKDIIKDSKAISAFKGYRGFPGYICTSINEQVVHGIPGKRVLKCGDILGIDVGVEKNGFFADAAVTIEIGSSVPERAKKLLRITEHALALGIEYAVEGKRVSDISYAIQEYVENCGYSVVKTFVGHGIGRKMHEDPEIPNFGKPGTGPRLKNGMVLAIEPMVNEGRYEVDVLPDGWSAVTRDRSLSAHFEHTVCITDKGPRVLT